MSDARILALAGARITGRPPPGGRRFPRLWWTAAAVWGLVALVSAGCGGSDGPDAGWVGTVDTVAGGVVVVRSPAEGVWRGAPWRLEPTLRIGALESGGPDQFGSIGDVTVDGLGRIYVLESQAREVRVFDPEGEHVRTFARPGGGPGELEAPVSLEWGPDGNLWVPDFRNRRYEVFDTAGSRVGGFPIGSGSLGFASAWRPDGLLYERTVLQAPEGNRLVSVRRRLAGDTLATLDTLPVPDIPEPETMPVTLTQGGRSMRTELPVPLTPLAVRAPAPEGGWWLSDPGRAYRIARLGPRGDTLRILEREYEPVPVTAEAVERALQRIPDGVEVPPDRIPEVHPPVESLHPGPADLWVRRRTAPERTGYEVFDADGRFLGELRSTVPLARFTLLERTSEAVYGALRGEFDEPYVVRLAIQRE